MDALSKKAKEGDVETQIVLPLLTGPQFLGIPHASIRSKEYLYPRKLDKAAGKTAGYYPDFSVWELAFPLLVVEAKAPAIEAEVGYREASLYALHLNRLYRENLDPCSYIIATNGKRILAGPWNAVPDIDAPVEDFAPGSLNLERLIAKAHHSALTQRARDYRQRTANEVIYYPTRGASRTTLLNSKLPPNQFAAPLVPTLTRFFSSPLDTSDPAVYDTAYVSTSEQLGYDAVLENLLREKAHHRANPYSVNILTTKSDSRIFSDRIAEYKNAQANTGQILLVLGHVGSGKSLFVRRYRNLLTPPDLGLIHWSFINFNSAPAQLAGSERWLSEAFVQGFREEQPEFDLTDDENMNRLFAKELNDNRSLYARLEKVSPIDAERERVADLRKWRDNPETLSRCITRYLSGDRGEPCIAVFDNVDRRDSEDQLIAFQMAIAFTTAHRTLTILQLRDETFERYKDSKPLDTFKTGINFHISPPRFTSVVKRRLDICLEHLRQNAPKTWEYEFSNGARVVITRDQALRFLEEIYGYVFRESGNTARVLQGLSGRNMREGLDLFFALLVSGHLSADLITSAGVGNGDLVITDDLVLRTLMRGDYRFFHGGSGVIRNVLFFDPQWLGADNLLVVETLFFLAMRLKARGTIGLEGFFSVDSIFDDLQRLGYPFEAIFSACQWLLKSGMIEANNMSSAILARRACVRISSSGFIHIRVLTERLEYLSGCLYDTPFVKPDMSEYVSGMFSDTLATNGISRSRKANGVQMLRKYIHELRSDREGNAPNLVGLSTGADYLLNHIDTAIAEVFRRRQSVADTDDLDLIAA